MNDSDEPGGDMPIISYNMDALSKDEARDMRAVVDELEKFTLEAIDKVLMSIDDPYSFWDCSVGEHAIVFPAYDAERGEQFLHLDLGSSAMIAIGFTDPKVVVEAGGWNPSSGNQTLPHLFDGICALLDEAASATRALLGAAG